MPAPVPSLRSMGDRSSVPTASSAPDSGCRAFRDNAHRWDSRGSADPADS